MNPTLIKGDNGVLYACSVGAMPHGGLDSEPYLKYLESEKGPNLDYVKNNGVDGVIDVHFMGSKTHADATYGVSSAHEDERHKRGIKKASQATKYLNMNSTNGGGSGGTNNGSNNNGSFGAPQGNSKPPKESFKTLHPPILGLKSVNDITTHYSSSHPAQDIAIMPYTTPASPSSGVLGKSYTPIVKIYSATSGKVVRVKCHKPSKTGDTLSGNKECSDHKTPYNQATPLLEGQYAYNEGDCVYVKAPDGYLYCYMHLYCGSVKVKIGDTVSPGTLLGYEGNTGHTTGRTGVHLHFQVNDENFTEYKNREDIVMLGMNVPQY